MVMELVVAERKRAFISSWVTASLLATLSGLRRDFVRNMAKAKAFTTSAMPRKKPKRGISDAEMLAWNNPMLNELEQQRLSRKLHKKYGSILLKECMGEDYETYLRLRRRAKAQADELANTLRVAIRVLGASDSGETRRRELEGMIALMEQLD